MSKQPNSPREPDDPMARMSNAVSEDYETLAGDEDTETTAHGTSGATPQPEGAEPPADR
jgi:hypothetical protein